MLKAISHRAQEAAMIYALYTAGRGIKAYFDLVVERFRKDRPGVIEL